MAITSREGERKSGGFHWMVLITSRVHVSDLDSTDYHAFTFHGIVLNTKSLTKCAGIHKVQKQ